MFNFLSQLLANQADIATEDLLFLVSIVVIGLLVLFGIIALIRTIIRNVKENKKFYRQNKIIENAKSSIRDGYRREQIRRILAGVTRYSNYKQDIFEAAYGKSVVILKVDYVGDVVSNVSYSSHIVNVTYN